MPSPKHLWSGDWERESNDSPPAYVAIPPESQRAPEPEPKPDSGHGTALKRRPDSRRMIIGALVLAGAVIVAVVLALTLGHSKSPALTSQAGVTPAPSVTTQSTPTLTSPQQTVPQSAAGAQASVPAGPTYDWLGMSINSTPNGITVSTVTPGSTADVAGVDPGDVIAVVGSTNISSVNQLTGVVKGLKIGQRFTLIVNRGSTPVTLTTTLTGRLSRQ